MFRFKVRPKDLGGRHTKFYNSALGCKIKQRLQAYLRELLDAPWNNTKSVKHVVYTIT